MIIEVNKKMTLTNKLNSIKEKTIASIEAPITLIAMYTGLVIAVNTALLPLQVAQELAFNGPKQNQHVKYINRDIAMGLNTKASWYTGEFETVEGDTLKLIDASSILDGKLFPNTVLGKMEPGKDYGISYREGLMGSGTIVSASHKGEHK